MTDGEQLSTNYCYSMVAKNEPRAVSHLNAIRTRGDVFQSQYGARIAELNNSATSTKNQEKAMLFNVPKASAGHTLSACSKEAYLKRSKSFNFQVILFCFPRARIQYCTHITLSVYLLYT